MKSLYNLANPKPLMKCVLISTIFCAICLIISALFLATPKVADLNSSPHPHDVSATVPTTLDHLVFGIASSGNSWPKRKEYAKLWWKPNNGMKGCVFVDSLPVEDHANNDTSLPSLCDSQDTSQFPYTYSGPAGSRSGIRVARVVKETVELNHSNVRWYVFGDDDTIFFPENLVKTLSKYDHRLWYYVGARSESYKQVLDHGFEMAYGGAGIVISSPLANVLAHVIDSCIFRYPYLYGSDGRVYSCITELGVGLTQEPGFHQVDMLGNMFGLLAAHPVTPVVSLHHIELTDPIFPKMTNLEAFQHLFEAVNVDSQRILQQTVCYDTRLSWTISVSWGYVVRVFQEHMALPNVLHVPKTFHHWLTGNDMAEAYNFNTRPLDPDRCKWPIIFFLHNVSSGKQGVTSSYSKWFQNCSYEVASLNKLQVIKVFSNKLDLDIKQLQNPRRQCCDVLASGAGDLMEVAIRECKDEELIYMH